jgi:hypothetical protein
VPHLPVGSWLYTTSRHASQVPKCQETSVRQASKSIRNPRKSKHMPHRVIREMVASCVARGCRGEPGGWRRAGRCIIMVRRCAFIIRHGYHNVDLSLRLQLRKSSEEAPHPLHVAWLRLESNLEGADLCAMHHKPPARATGNVKPKQRS